mmetsp:Transcript_33412/g.80808  ORF Transcript_33412/g.80808 Transcript_33412/m.80808 type:complete len:276 (-) Transcript_33412:114-941(-)
MMTKATPICPFTLKSLATIKRENVAVIYERNPLVTNDPSDEAGQRVQCGHSCTLSCLVPYLHDIGGSKSCPVCQASPAVVICDYHSSAYLVNDTTNTSDGDTSDKNEGRIISFRYGTNFYFLRVPASTSLSSSSYTSKLSRHRNGNALNRIGSVLGMDVRSGLKVIYKGKVIYPDKSGDNCDDISEHLLDITSRDLIQRRKKPSLVVMGLRQQKADVTDRSPLDLLLNIVRRLTPWHLWKLMTNGLQWSIHATTSLVGGICLFIRSILYPPQPTH